MRLPVQREGRQRVAPFLGAALVLEGPSDAIEFSGVWQYRGWTSFALLIPTLRIQLPGEPTGAPEDPAMDF